MLNSAIAANVQPIVQPVVQTFDLGDLDIDEPDIGDKKDDDSPGFKSKKSGDGDDDEEEQKESEEDEDNYMEMYVQD